MLVFGIPGGWELIILTVALVPLVLMLYALIDVLKREFPDSIQKLIWVLVILLFPFFGSIIYLVIGRNSKREFNMPKRH